MPRLLNPNEKVKTHSKDKKLSMSPFLLTEEEEDQSVDRSTPIIVDYPDRSGDPSSGTKTFLIHAPDGPRLPPSSRYNPSVSVRTTWASASNSDLVVLFDMDGVLADFDGGVRKLVSEHGLPLPEEGAHDILSDPAYKSVLDVVKGSETFWLGLEPIPEGVSAFKALGDMAYICSSPGFPVSATPKIAWCLQHLGAKPDRVVLTSAKHLLASPYSYLVDDRADNCADFDDAGGTAILVVSPGSFNGEETVEDKIIQADKSDLKVLLTGMFWLYSEG